MQKPFSDIKVNTPEVQEQERQVFKESIISYERPHKNGRAKLFLWIFAVLSIIALFFGVSGYFTRAKIFVSPQVKTFSFKEEPVNFSRTDISDVHFEIMSLKGFVEGNIHLDTTATMNVKASGKVTIFNKEKKPVILSKGLSLKTDDGLIYKLKEGVTVPGFDDLLKAPGSILAQIEASEVGDTFNINNANFNFPSFAKTSKFVNVYAVNEGSISGGIQGTVYTLEEDLYKIETSKLDQSLKDKLFIQAKAQAPAGYILYKDLSVLVPDNTSNTLLSKNSDTVIKREGKLIVYMVEESSLMEYIKSYTKTDFDIKEFTVPELQNFVFSFQPSQDPENVSSINTLITVEGRIVSIINTKKLKQLLLGVSKNNVEKMLVNFPTVATAVTKITPIWQNVLPKDENRLEIIVNPPKELTLE